jgi:hypothetical protein
MSYSHELKLRTVFKQFLKFESEIPLGNVTNVSTFMKKSKISIPE